MFGCDGKAQDKGFGCNILFFTRNSDHEQTDFHTDNRVTRFTNWFHSVDFYAEWRLV